jgi:uncharacterized protein YecE (DUF72 family)
LDLLDIGILLKSILVGCAGWEYDDWIGPFYPKNLQKDHHLAYYAKFFDFTEVNSTFYSLPSEVTVNRWEKAVPETFRFAVKVWQQITHNMAGAELNARIEAFFDRMRGLEPKVKGYLLQFPPSFKYTDKRKQKLLDILSQIPTEKPVFVELRDNKWFDESILQSFIDGARVVLVTNYKEGVKPIYLSNQNTYYIRLVGDRALTVFNKIQRTQDKVLEEVKQKLNSFERSPEFREALINFNNHFRGFSPQDANEFKQALGLPYQEFKQQRTLSDFMSPKI